MHKRNLTIILAACALILLLSLIYLSNIQQAKARGLQLQSAPQLISYQGFLTDDVGEPINGEKNMVFRVFSTAYGYEVLWQESHIGVAIQSGDFSVHLGENTPFPDGLFSEPERWLEIEVEGVILTPRQRFNSVPYALNADTLDGHDAEELMGGDLPPGAIVWFPEGSHPPGFTRHATALGEDVGAWEPIAVSPVSIGIRYFLNCNIWTGSEILCWGGIDETGTVYGLRYNFGENSWSPISTINSPQVVYGYSVIWTGTEMIIWGGRKTTDEVVNSGARYDPISDTWTTMSMADAPTPRIDHGAIWTGKEMIIWGGYIMGDGHRYNPIDDTWTQISLENAPSARTNNIIVWTGSEMIIWGGWYTQENYSVNLTNGAMYNPVTDSWTQMSNLGGVTGYSGIPWSTAVWTGTEMATTFGNQIFFYNPDSDSWRSQHCFQYSAGPGALLMGQIVLAGDFLVTQGSLFSLSQNRAIATIKAMYWSNLFWTGQELLMLEVPGFSSNITGMRHTIDLIYPYQKD